MFSFSRGRLIKPAVWGAFVCAAIIPAIAAVTPNSAVMPQAPNTKATTFVQGTDAAGTYKTVYTGGTNGSKIIGIYVTTNDGSAAHLVTIQYSTSTSAHCGTNSCFGGAAVTVPTSSGFANGAPSVNMLNPANWPGLPVDASGNPYLFLPTSSTTLEATFATALTSSDVINVVVIAADF